MAQQYVNGAWVNVGETPTSSAAAPAAALPTGLFRGSGDFGSSLYYNAGGGNVQQVNLLDPSLVGSTTGNAGAQATAALAKLQSSYGINYSSLPEYNPADFAAAGAKISSVPTSQFFQSATNSMVNGVSTFTPGGTPQPTNSTQTTTTPANAAQPTSYTIKSGDTLSAIAAANGTNIQAILAANPSITNANKISAGSQIQIPGQKTLATSSTNPLSTVASSVYGAVSSVPDQNDTSAVTSAASGAISSIGAADTSNPIGAAISPIVENLNNLASSLLTPGATSQSLSQEYANLQSQYGLPAMQTQLLNLQNIMSGTTDDIRAEVTAGNGFATESMVQGMATARNNVILKQYNTLQAAYTSAQDTVNNQMQFAEADQQQANEQLNSATGIEETLASLQSTMVTNSQKQYNDIITQVGYSGLAQIVAGDPTQQAVAEQALGLPQGTLSDADTVSQLQTFKQQTIAQGAQRIYIQGVNAGVNVAPGNGTQPAPIGGTTTGSGGTTEPAAASTYTVKSGDSISAIASSLGLNKAQLEAANPQIANLNQITPGEQINLPGQNTAAGSALPSSLSNSDMTSLYTAAKSQGANVSYNQSNGNMTINGVTFTHNGDGSYTNSAGSSSTGSSSSSPLSPAAQQLSTEYTTIQSDIANAPQYQGSALNTRRESMAATAAIKNYINLPIFQTLSGASQYLAKIEAAAQSPGSVTDIDLLDSYINLSKGSGQVTESQINGIEDGSSVSDNAQKLLQSVQNGGVLSSNQRSALESLTQQVYSNYQTLYQPVYVEAIQNMQKQGIPAAFWGQMPDLDQLSQLGDAATNLNQ